MIVLKPEQELKESEFYADAETLKHSSGYYTFMNSMPMNPNLWVENCQDCKKAMTRIILTRETEVYSIKSNQRLSPNNDSWYCDKCHHVWMILGNSWVTVKINNEETFNPEKIKGTQVKVKENVVVKVIDPGPKPSEDATQCPECKAWRDIEDYPPDGELQRKHHVCKSCKLGEIYNLPKEN